MANKVRITLYLDRDISDQAQAIADQNDVSLSWVVRKSLAAYVKSQNEVAGMKS